MIHVVSRIALVFALSLVGCLSDKAPGGEVGSETHFLSACTASTECAGGFDCICGLCTATCSDACESGACAAAASPAVLSWCGGALAPGLCLATCDAAFACEDGLCQDGFCGAAARPDGTPCTTADQCAGGQCVLGFCGTRCMLPDDLCDEGAYCFVPGAASGVCVPGVLEAFPAAVYVGRIGLGRSASTTFDLANRAPRPLTITHIQVGTRISGEAPTEVVVDTPLPIALATDGLARIVITVTPGVLRDRQYELTIRVAEAEPPLVVYVDFTGIEL